MRGSAWQPAAAIKWFKEERWLTLAGVFGLLLAVGCAIYGWLVGEAAPEGVFRAASFNAALGMFIVSTAAIIPVAELGRKSRAFFRWFYVILALYSYATETIQHFRGVNPRFVIDGSRFDETVASIFAIVALLLVVVYLFVAGAFFRRRPYTLRPELVLGIRYAMIAVVISFAAGIWISMNQGRYTEAGGNIIWLHGLGFHALQAVPLVAWLAQRTPYAGKARLGLVHLSGITFVLGLMAVAAQTYLGRTLFEWSVLPIIAIDCFLVSLVVGGVALSKAGLLGDVPAASAPDRKG